MEADGLDADVTTEVARQLLEMTIKPKGAKLTLKVSGFNAGQYEGSPTSDTGNRVIKRNGLPLYSKNDVRALLEDPKSVQLWTAKCQRDVYYKLDIDPSGVADIVRAALDTGRYRGAEWCEQSPGGPYAGCDAYDVQISAWNEAAKKEMPCDYYVKFAIAKSGELLLVVSCHLPEDRR